MDKLEFKLIIPYEEGERWAKDFGSKEARAVAIYINGRELLSLAAEMENADDPSAVSHDYGHIAPLILYRSLTSDIEFAPIACCGNCGEIGCWSIRANVKNTYNAVVWDIHGERFGENILHFEFDPREYGRQINELCTMAERDAENAFKGLFWCKSEGNLITVKIPCSFMGNVPRDYRWMTPALSKSGDNYTHKGAWMMLDESITERHPFHYYPRGRVEIKDGKAVIYLNPSLADEAHISVIKNEFLLDPRHGISEVIVKADGSKHYGSEV